MIVLNSTTFIPSHGDGSINMAGDHNQTGWSESQLKWGNFTHNNPSEYTGPNCDGYYPELINSRTNFQCYGEWGFRLCRSAE
jgi:hypothetical protein